MRLFLNFDIYTNSPIFPQIYILNLLINIYSLEFEIHVLDN